MAPLIPLLGRLKGFDLAADVIKKDLLNSASNLSKSVDSEAKDELIKVLRELKNSNNGSNVLNNKNLIDKFKLHNKSSNIFSAAFNNNAVNDVYDSRNKPSNQNNKRIEFSRRNPVSKPIPYTQTRGINIKNNFEKSLSFTMSDEVKKLIDEICKIKNNSATDTDFKKALADLNEEELSKLKESFTGTNDLKSVADSMSKMYDIFRKIHENSLQKQRTDKTSLKPQSYSYTNVFLNQTGLDKNLVEKLINYLEEQEENSRQQSEKMSSSFTSIANTLGMVAVLGTAVYTIACYFGFGAGSPGSAGSRIGEIKTSEAINAFKVTKDNVIALKREKIRKLVSTACKDKNYEYILKQLNDSSYGKTPKGKVDIQRIYKMMEGKYANPTSISGEIEEFIKRLPKEEQKALKASLENLDEYNKFKTSVESSEARYNKRIQQVNENNIKKIQELREQSQKEIKDLEKSFDENLSEADRTKKIESVKSKYNNQINEIVKENDLEINKLNEQKKLELDKLGKKNYSISKDKANILEKTRARIHKKLNCRGIKILGKMFSKLNVIGFGFAVADMYKYFNTNCAEKIEAFKDLYKEELEEERLSGKTDGVYSTIVKNMTLVKNWWVQDIVEQLVVATGTVVMAGVGAVCPIAALAAAGIFLLYEYLKSKYRNYKLGFDFFEADFDEPFSFINRELLVKEKGLDFAVNKLGAMNINTQLQQAYTVLSKDQNSTETMEWSFDNTANVNSFKIRLLASTDDKKNQIVILAWVMMLKSFIRNYVYKKSDIYENEVDVYGPSGMQGLGKSLSDVIIGPKETYKYAVNELGYPFSILWKTGFWSDSTFVFLDDFSKISPMEVIESVVNPETSFFGNMVLSLSFAYMISQFYKNHDIYKYITSENKYVIKNNTNRYFYKFNVNDIPAVNNNKDFMKSYLRNCATLWLLYGVKVYGDESASKNVKSYSKFYFETKQTIEPYFKELFKFFDNLNNYTALEAYILKNRDLFYKQYFNEEDDNYIGKLDINTISKNAGLTDDVDTVEIYKSDYAVSEDSVKDITDKYTELNTVITNDEKEDLADSLVKEMKPTDETATDSSKTDKTSPADKIENTKDTKDEIDKVLRDTQAKNIKSRLITKALKKLGFTNKQISDLIPILLKLKYKGKSLLDRFDSLSAFNDYFVDMLNYLASNGNLTKIISSKNSMQLMENVTNIIREDTNKQLELNTDNVQISESIVEEDDINTTDLIRADYSDIDYDQFIVNKAEIDNKESEPTNDISAEGASIKGNYKIIYDTLRTNGITHEGALGVLGNIYQESKGNPFIINPSDKDSKGNSQPSFGIVQWRGPRFENVLKHISSSNPQLAQIIAQESRKATKVKTLNIPNEYLNEALKLETEFVVKELAQTNLGMGRGSLLDYLKTTDDINKSADLFVRKFERPANVDKESVNRQQFANSFNEGKIPAAPVYRYKEYENETIVADNVKINNNINDQPSDEGITDEDREALALVDTFMNTKSDEDMFATTVDKSIPETNIYNNIVNNDTELAQVTTDKAETSITNTQNISETSVANQTNINNSSEMMITQNQQKTADENILSASMDFDILFDVPGDYFSLSHRYS